MSIERTPLESVVEIYATLREAARLEFNTGSDGVPDFVSISRILTFLEGYRSDLEFKVKIYNFQKNRDTDEMHQSLFSGNGTRSAPLIRSFNRIYERDRGGKDSKRFLSEIHLDTHTNYCWARFATIKEACHVLFILEHENYSERYPYTHSDKDVRSLLKSIHTLPFSVLDFQNVDYSLGLKIENAAEMLAYLLLAGHDRIIQDRVSFRSLDTDDQDDFDFFPTADEYKSPRRYTELFISDEKIVGQFLDDVLQSLGSSAFDSVPAPDFENNDGD